MRNENDGAHAVHSNQPQADDRLADLGFVFEQSHVAERLKEASPTAYAAAARFWRSGYEASALTPRMKELVMVALHATITSLDAAAVRRHIGRALSAGASTDDVLDVLVTMVGIANHALYFAVPILMREMQAAGHPEAELPPISAESQAIKDDFIRTRGFWNEQRDAIVRLMPEYFSALAPLSAQPWQNGSLTDKERELVCIAIDCTVTHMYEPGLAIHIRNALKQGASRAEILEVFHLAAVTGLEGYIMGAEVMFAPSL